MRGKEMHWDFNHIYFVREDPEIQGSPLLRAFLAKLIEDFDRVTLADIRKLGGSQGALEELRNSCIRYEPYHKDESEGCKVGKVIRDESPWCRYEHVIKHYPDGNVKKECHIYVLDDDPRDYFTVADEYLIR